MSHHLEHINFLFFFSSEIYERSKKQTTVLMVFVRNQILNKI